MNLEAMKGCGKIQVYDKGAFICREGDEGHTAYIVLKGQVAIVLKSYSPSPEVIAKLVAGNFVGEMSLLLGKPRTASVLVLETDTIVLEINHENFKTFLQRDPETCYKLLKSLLGRIEAMLERLGPSEPRVVFQYRKSNAYQIAGNVNLVTFTEMAEKQPSVAIKLITNLCSSLDDFNIKYIKNTSPAQ